MNYESIVHIANMAIGTAFNFHNERVFRSFFGIEQVTCAYLCDLMKETEESSIGPKQILWALYFLRVYAVEDINAAMCKTTRKTFREKVWIVIKLIASLKLVRILFSKNTFNF